MSILCHFYGGWFHVELVIRQNKGLLSPSTILLAVDDPRPNIGSGSATLNALLCVTEYLAAHNNERVKLTVMIVNRNQLPCSVLWLDINVEVYLPWFSV